MNPCEGDTHVWDWDLCPVNEDGTYVEDFPCICEEHMLSEARVG